MKPSLNRKKLVLCLILISSKLTFNCPISNCQECRVDSSKDELKCQRCSKGYLLTKIKSCAKRANFLAYFIPFSFILIIACYLICKGIIEIKCFITGFEKIKGSKFFKKYIKKSDLTNAENHKNGNLIFKLK